MKLVEYIIQTFILVLTEIFPISSSGHFSFIKHFRGGKDFSSLGLIIARFILIIPIVLIFRKTFLMLLKEFVNIIKDIKNKKFSFKSMDGNRKVFIFILISSLFYTLVFILTKNISIRLYNDLDIIVEGVFFLMSGSILFFADRKMPENNLEVDLTLFDSSVSGSLKGLSGLPGFTGNGSMLSCLIYRGFNREFAASISIIMLIPSLLLKNFFALRNIPKDDFTPDNQAIFIIIAISLVLGFLLIKLLQLIVRSDRLNIFANYMIITGGVIMILGIVESVLDVTIYDFFANVLSLLT